MVKLVVGEETQMNLAEERLSQSGIFAQVGLVVGKLNAGSEKGFVFGLVPTPPNDAGEPACLLSESAGAKKKGSKVKSQSETASLVIDTQWVAEHARQVCKMLLGGMHVIGVYVWASESSFKASSITLCQTLKVVAEAAPFYESTLDERLLIHISYSPRRWSCRNCVVAPSITSTSLRPCDFKMGKVLAALQTFRCMHNFEVRVPIYQEDASSPSTLGDVLRKGILYQTKELKYAKALVDGNLVIKDQLPATDNTHEVEFLLPLMKDVPIEVCSTKEVIGLVVFHGAIYASTYLSPKEPISQAISDIKGDIITSLRSRLDIICDEEEGALDLTADGGEKTTDRISTEMPVHQLILDELRKPCDISFPRRVFIPWLDGVFICDYLQPSETFEDLRERCKEMMSMEVPTDTSAILEPETEAQATPLTTKCFWDIVGGNSGSLSDPLRIENEKAKERGSSKYRNGYTLTAIAILLLSILVGVGMIALGSSGAAN